MVRSGAVISRIQGGQHLHSTLAVAVAVLALSTGAAACGERHRVDHHIWTLFDIQQALHAGGNVAMGPTFPSGMPATDFLTAGSGYDTLAVMRAFSEGEPAAIVTTEIWVNYDEVWVQPGFFQVTDPGRADPYLRRSDGSLAPALFDVGPESGFYSPFWQLSEAVVGDLTDPDHYRSTRALREAGVPTLPMEAHAGPLRPLDVPVLGAAPGAHPVEPWHGAALPDIPARDAWIDGRKLGFFDFGAEIFSTEVYGDEGVVVEPLPLFVFFTADATGAIAPVPMAPKVGGVGDLFSGAAANEGDATGAFSAPHFGAFWRLTKAVLPAGAGAFHAGEHPGVAPAGVDLVAYEGRVALDATCFAAADFPAGCSWLDSQAKIEAGLGRDAIAPTELLATCPFMFYDGKPVQR
jgi:hypothetical protein